MGKARAFFTSIFIILLTGVMSILAIVTMPLSPRGNLYLTLARIWSQIIFFVGGIKYQVHIPAELDRQQSYLYLSNHESLTDILALYATLDQKVRCV